MKEPPLTTIIMHARRIVTLLKRTLNTMCVTLEGPLDNDFFCGETNIIKMISTLHYAEESKLKLLASNNKLFQGYRFIMTAVYSHMPSIHKISEHNSTH